MGPAQAPAAGPRPSRDLTAGGQTRELDDFSGRWVRIGHPSPG